MFLFLEIFFLRIIDVGLGVVRTIYIVKGKKFISSILAFLEIITWYYAARTALVSDNLLIGIFYALGYTFGTLLGMIINEKIINEIYSVRIISNKIKKEYLNKNGYGCTLLGNNILLCDIEKKKYDKLISLIKNKDNDAYIVVNEAKCTYNGYLTSSK